MKGVWACLILYFNPSTLSLPFLMSDCSCGEMFSWTPQLVWNMHECLLSFPLFVFHRSSVLSLSLLVLAEKLVKYSVGTFELMWTLYEVSLFVCACVSSSFGFEFESPSSGWKVGQIFSWDANYLSWLPFKASYLQSTARFLEISKYSPSQTTLNCLSSWNDETGAISSLMVWI